jgi:hypothetical protein
VEAFMHEKSHSRVCEKKEKKSLSSTRPSLLSGEDMKRRKEKVSSHTKKARS